MSANGVYLGPCCPVCNVPLAAHHADDTDSGCFTHLPVAIYVCPPSAALLAARKIDADEVEKARASFKAGEPERAADREYRRQIAENVQAMLAMRAVRSEPDIRQLNYDWRTGQLSNVGA